MQSRTAEGFDEAMEAYCRDFHGGTFDLRRGDLLRVASKGVPDAPGVYAVYAVKDDQREVVYIGKAGTLRPDGEWKKQGLHGRLNAIQDDVPRQEFFQDKISKEELDALSFRWLVTYGKGSQILPAKAEADLLQKYFELHRKLPRWNRAL